MKFNAVRASVAGGISQISRSMAAILESLTEPSTCLKNVITFCPGVFSVQSSHYLRKYGA
jgi:hypothetical protein